ncbi:MAG: polymer-forming cytoskeletal protein [Spirochaetes bacterium]|uniref:Polymer-forming cytoskeletal protein n=1 Tax=Candidatus Avitreponema avistercoris TaxID=2840705 RepID=A0A9D9HDD2_9SPIR|nr:polymer-forming cytoskeletal protein [Candidatus Avitreponema avistercoris]
MAENNDNDILDLDEEDYSTVLAPDIEFNGLIEFSDPLMIRGKVDGRIHATSDLLVDTGAVVNADIHARRVVIKGSVRGNIVAGKIVRVFSTGKLNGDITAPEVVLDTGCFFSGSCTMNREADA